MAGRISKEQWLEEIKDIPKEDLDLIKKPDNLTWEYWNKKKERLDKKIRDRQKKVFNKINEIMKKYGFN